MEREVSGPDDLQRTTGNPELGTLESPSSITGLGAISSRDSHPGTSQSEVTPRAFQPTSELQELGAGEETNPIGTVEGIRAQETRHLTGERRWVMAAFVSVYVAVMIAACSVYWWKVLTADVSDPTAAGHLNTLVTLAIGTVGPIAGFYFGQEKTR